MLLCIVFLCVLSGVKMYDNFVNSDDETAREILFVPNIIGVKCVESRTERRDVLEAINSR